MSKKRTSSAPVPPERFFVKELAGEAPPSFAAMERLYRLASDLYGLRPWRVLDKDNLIAVRDSVTGELCYCSIMCEGGAVRSFSTCSNWKNRSTGRLDDNQPSGTMHLNSVPSL